MVRIGITAGEIDNKEDPWSPTTYGQTHTYSDAVIQAGGVPLILPLTRSNKALRQAYETMDGMLFAGGNDLSPAMYGEKPAYELNNVSAFRDSYEAQLMRWALQDKKPLLAICRGMQLLNVIKGGTLYQDIAAQLPSASDHTASTQAKDRTFIAHKLRIKSGSQFAKIIGDDPLPTNTHHHQAIKKLGDQLVVVAWAEDGVIEAIELKNSGWVIGVQSHPEALVVKAEPRWQKLFTALVDAAAP